MTFEEWWRSGNAAEIAERLGLDFLDEDEQEAVRKFSRSLWEAAQPEWRPIETAPEDTAIICCNEPGNVGEACFISSISNPAWYWAADMMPIPEGLAPTKWMPLPHPPEESQMIDLVIWPDNEWCYLEELEEYAHKSDDYVRTSVPNWVEEDDYPKYDDVIKRNAT